jgi:hypothetical protein
MQIPCFLEFTGRVALQNIENKEVPCKIFLNKELRDVSAASGRFRVVSLVPECEGPGAPSEEDLPER